MESSTGYRLWLKLRVGTTLGTEEAALTASVAGREVVIESESRSQPLKEASWLLIGCRGFEAEDEARDFGEKLRRAAHMAGLCARVGVDAGDPGEDRTVSWVNPEFLRETGALDPDTRLGSDIHGLQVLPDDEKTVFVRLGRATGSVCSNAGDFVQALQDALPKSDEPAGDFPLDSAGGEGAEFGRDEYRPDHEDRDSGFHRRRVGDRSAVDGRTEGTDRKCRRLA